MREYLSARTTRLLRERTFSVPPLSLSLALSVCLSVLSSVRFLRRSSVSRDDIIGRMISIVSISRGSRTREDKVHAYKCEFIAAREPARELIVIRAFSLELIGASERGGLQGSS